MTLVIAHRGFSGKYPENTLLAIKKAAALGIDGVEMDVRATSDRKIVLFHDRSLKRMTGSDAKLSEVSYQELQRLWVRGIEKVPLLSQALKLLKKTKMKHIILDAKAEGLEREIIDEIVKKRMTHRVVISTRLSSSIMKLRDLNKHIRLAYIMDNRPGSVRTWKKLNKKVGLYSINHFHKRALLTRRFVKKVKHNGLKDMTWFMQGYWKEEWMKDLVNMGVDGIITDYPDRLSALLSMTRIQR
jgi:glycerophosphoryl diester phosphodiesterase